MRFDLVVHNGTIVTVNAAFDLIPDGMIAIREGRLARIEARSPDLPLPPADALIDARGGIIMPGLVNTHTHLPMTLFRGLADDLPLSVWLDEHIFPAEGRHINPESVRWGALLACAEMALSGTTTCCDGYFYEDEVAEAVAGFGLRAVLGQGLVDFPAPGVPDPARNISTALAYAAKWQARSATICPSLFCHAPYTCSKATLQKAKAAADARGLLFQIHAAETRNEWDQIQAAHRKTPIQYLDQLGILNSRTLLVHCVWINAEDIETIAARGAKVSHNPGSNMKLAAGIAPIAALLEKEVTVGLGTDGCASNNNLDLFQEMDLAAKLHKADTLDPTVLNARTVLEMATIGGARALGLETAIGSLEIGKQADVIVIDTRRPHLVPLYHPASHLVYSANGADVKDVVVAGRILVKDRELTNLDLAELLAQVNRISRAIGT
ncbi:MAG: amidohydrolase [Desulfobacterales bacterium]|nr:MAG: amidohydrolase [Desulfobacterales bacterium]